MPKLVLFLALIVGIASVLVLNNFKDLEVNNEHFDLAELTREPVKEEVAPVEEEPQEPKKFVMVLNTPELKNGHEIYTNKGQCITCHGDKGQGNPDELGPRIAGQFDWYIIEQINHFRSKERVNEKMEPYIKNLTEKEIQDVATYVSTYPWNEDLSEE